MKDVPKSIRSLMAAKKIKNLRQLALAMGFDSAPGTVYRMFNGKHRTLATYGKIARICKWTLEEFMKIAHQNNPEHVSFILRGRLKSLDISTYQFRAYLYASTGGGGGSMEYLDGTHRYDRLNLYWSLKTALGITADTMYESLIMSESLTNLNESEKLSSSNACSVSTNLLELKQAS